MINFSPGLDGIVLATLSATNRAILKNKQVSNTVG